MSQTGLFDNIVSNLFDYRKEQSGRFLYGIIKYRLFFCLFPNQLLIGVHIFNDLEQHSQKQYMEQCSQHSAQQTVYNTQMGTSSTLVSAMPATIRIVGTTAHITTNDII